MTGAFCIYLPSVPGFVGRPGFGRSRPTAHLHHAALFPTQGAAQDHLARWQETQVGELYSCSDAMVLPVAAWIAEDDQ